MFVSPPLGPGLLLAAAFPMCASLPLPLSIMRRYEEHWYDGRRRLGIRVAQRMPQPGDGGV